MDYKDCIIIYKNGSAVTLRANKLTACSEKNVVYVYDNDSIIAIINMEYVKTVLFDVCGDAQAMVDAINGVVFRLYDKQ